MFILHFVVYYMGYNSPIQRKAGYRWTTFETPQRCKCLLSQTNHQCDDFIGVINIMKVCHDFRLFIDILFL